MNTKVGISSEQKLKIEQAFQRIGTISGTARATNTDRGTVRKYLKEAGLYSDRPMFAGRINEREVTTLPLPKKNEVNRFILTCLQNNTPVNQRVWDNLRELADFYEATIYVGTFTYNKSSYGPKAVKRGTKTSADNEELWYDPQAEPFINDGSVELAPGLVWCGEMNILPTAVRPLEGLEVYTARKSGIIPHVKVQMASVASSKFESTKFNYTTGTVGKRNYLQRKAGLKAEFHHSYGGLLVEVDHLGDWFVRQIIADDNGVMHDLGLKIDANGELTEDNRVQAITWGDIHQAEIEPMVEELAWGNQGMIDILQPKLQVMHDLLDFRARNGHTARLNLIHDRFAAFIKGQDSVEDEVQEMAKFLDKTSRDWCQTLIVDSNHNSFMLEWLRVGDYRRDPINAIYFLEAQLQVYKSIAANPEKATNLIRWAAEQFLGQRDNLKFLDEDESFIDGGIEYGLHGHRGPNGSRGTPTNLARMGHKMNRGHEHSAGIFEGVYTAGVSGKLDQGYNVGPSSWSHSHIITYPNGKRAIVTMWNNKWRAGN